MTNLQFQLSRTKAELAIILVEGGSVACMDVPSLERLINHLGKLRL
jgi:hypothetical protein